MLLAVGASFPKCPPLAQNHSEAVSLCGLFAFCANPPPTTPATYCWESLQCHVSQSALPSVCLTLCLCCHGEVHSLMVCKPGSSQIPVCLSCYSSYLLACLPYGSTVCLLANIWDVWSSHVASLCYSLISVCVVCCFPLSCASLVLLAEFRFLVSYSKPLFCPPFGCIFISYFQPLVGLNHAFIFYTLQFVATH